MAFLCWLFVIGTIACCTLGPFLNGKNRSDNDSTPRFDPDQIEW